MSKEEPLEVPGVVSEVLPNAIFRVKLDNDREIVADTDSRLHKARIEVAAGDQVIVEIMPYDLTKGRIILRVR